MANSTTFAACAHGLLATPSTAALACVEFGAILQGLALNRPPCLGKNVVMGEIQIERLSVSDLERARTLFTLMADVFEMESKVLSREYLTQLLMRGDFWALAASIGGRTVGGLTAHTLPLTHAELSEVFIYDIAVMPEYQRRGVGRRLVTTLRADAAAAGIGVVFVPADNEDTHALDFYHALGGSPAPVTIFTFSGAAP